MVTKATIKGLEFETLEDYFGYILDSKTNGNHKQSAALYKALSKKQKADFENYFSILYIHDMAEGITTERAILDIKNGINTTY